MVNHYTLDDYAAIESAGFNYSLPESIQTTVKKLIIDLGVSSASPYGIMTEQRPSSSNPRYPSSAAVSSANDRQNKYKKQRTSDKPLTKKPPSMTADTLWEKQPVFVATKIEKKEGTEKIINDIRVSLNKISAKNYDTHRDAIFQNIANLQNENAPKESLLDNQEQDKITAAIFEIASTNKFYSELYASLYSELTAKYPSFNDIIKVFIDTAYLQNIHLIEYVDESKDYGKFCLINKENDKRKAMSVFIVNLMKKGLVTRVKVIEIIMHLIQLVCEYIEQPNKTYEVEEITENIFLLLTTANRELIAEPAWNAVVEKIVQCSQYKVKEHPSISSRSIFKYKDAADAIKKY